jgi:acetyltransferase
MVATAPDDTVPGGGLRPLGPLLSPASVAIVGASERRGDLIRTVQRHPGLRTWLVNPRRAEVLGQRAHPSVAALPEVPDVAMVVVGEGGVEAAVEEAVAAGAGGLVVPGLGAEAGARGPSIARRVAALAGEVPMLGTNCMGYARPDGPSLWMGTPSSAFAAGGVAVVSQSGSVAEAMVAVGPRVGFRVVVSSGAELSRDAADFVAAFADDGEIRSVGLFLEAVRRPTALAAALRRCADAGKAVVCLKVGRSERAAAVAMTHTGAMVGSAVAFDAFLRSHGAIGVDDVPDLVETLEVLGRRRRPSGRRLAAVSESGGEAGLLADHAEAAGLELPALPAATADALRAAFPNYVDPHNPLDAWAVDDVERVFPGSMRLLRDSGSCDILAAVLELTRFRSPADQQWCALILRALADIAGEGPAGAAAHPEVFPAVISATSADPGDELVELARAADIALLRGMGPATRALAAAARWSEQRRSRTAATAARSAGATAPRSAGATAARSGATAIPPGGGTPVDLTGLLRPGALPEWESATILGRYGVRFAPFRRAGGPHEAALAASELGGTVVVKVDGPAHKSAAGGVVLGLREPDAARAAAARLGGSVLVARQVPPGPEVICGMLRDPLYGPVVSTGAGGWLAEALGAAGARLAPLTAADAEDLAGAVPGLPQAGPAHDGIAATLLALSRLAVEHPEIVSVDVNPLVVSAEGVTAVDALVVVAEPPATTSPPPTPPTKQGAHP